MKKLIVICALFISSAFAAEFKTVAEAETKLSAYTIEDIKGDEQRYLDGKPLKIDEIYDDLKEVANFSEKNKVTEELAVQIQRVCLLASLRDKSNEAVEIALPVYQKNKSLFNKGRKRFDPEDQKELKNVFEGADRASTKGTG